MFIAGSCHKGLGANHLYKVMKPKRDHLTFYRVGGIAADGNTPLELRAETGAFESYCMREKPAWWSSRSTRASTQVQDCSPGKGEPGRDARAVVGERVAGGQPGIADRETLARWRAGMTAAGRKPQVGASGEKRTVVMQNTGYLCGAHAMASCASHIHSLAFAGDG